MLSTALALSPALARAESRAVEQSRFINGTVGAVAGALVGGPIGLIAGAALGYSMGPEIAGTQATFGQRRRVTRHARRGRTGARSTRIVLDCANPANQENPACIDFWAKRRQLQPQQALYPQQTAYPQPGLAAQPGYAQQPVYMAPAQHGYSPLPAQLPQQAGDPRQRNFNPRQNPLVPPPTAFGGAAQYSAALSGPNAPGQQGASGGYAGSYSAPAPQGYGYGQVQAAPVPVPR
ncbi:MAG TPA: hypothetical protein PKA55_15685 [Rhodoblastus sp.]|nr:hypothetical protein [Rhodoblastus sp.]